MFRGTDHPDRAAIHGPAGADGDDRDGGEHARGRPAGGRAVSRGRAAAKLESRVAAGQDSLSSTSSVVILDSDDLVADPGKPDLRTNCRTPAAIPSSLNSHTFPLNVVFSHYPRQRVPWKIFVPPYQLNMCHQ